jgi:hypothetical protein
MPDATASQHPTSCNEDRKGVSQKGEILLANPEPEFEDDRYTILEVSIGNKSE